VPDAPDAKPAAGSKLGFLGRKIGPVPIWVIGLVAVGGYYWWTHYGPGKPAPVAAAATTTAGPEIIEVRGDRGPRGPKGPKGNQSKVVTVPDVVGEKYKPAGAKIRAAGLIDERQAPYVGTVRSERPHAGAKVPRGTVVTLRGKPWPVQPRRGAQPATAAPVMASAPMTAGDIYGSQPTAMPNGQTYDSGDATAALGAASAIAG
jgi:hypothetical protein